MASRGIYYIFTVLCITAVKSGGFVTVKCEAKNVGHFGQQSLLKCVVHTSKDVTDPTVLVVAWKKLSSPEDKDGQTVLGYNKGIFEPKSGYKFAEPSWNEKNMNVSLLITDTAVTDEGDYSCMVITDSGEHTSFTTLNVQAKYRIPTIISSSEKIVPKSVSTLTCKSAGGYPEGKLRWFDKDNYEWTASAEMEVERTDGGLLQLTSRLPLFEGSTSLQYTCVVFNASGVKEEEFTIEIPEDSSFGRSKGNMQVEPSTIVAPLVVIGSLIIGLLFVLLYRKRSQKARRDSTAPLMDGHHTVRTEQDVEAGGDQSDEKESRS